MKPRALQRTRFAALVAAALGIALVAGGVDRQQPGAGASASAATVQQLPIDAFARAPSGHARRESPHHRRASERAELADRTRSDVAQWAPPGARVDQPTGEERLSAGRDGRDLRRRALLHCGASLPGRNAGDRRSRWASRTANRDPRRAGSPGRPRAFWQAARDAAAPATRRARDATTTPRTIGRPSDAATARGASDATACSSRGTAGHGCACRAATNGRSRHPSAQLRDGTRRARAVQRSLTAPDARADDRLIRRRPHVAFGGSRPRRATPSRRAS
jgi:hypothetical protein